MDWYTAIKEKLKAGWIIREEWYPDEKVSIYQIVKGTAPNEKTIFCEVGRNIAMMLKKELGIKRIKRTECHALNFIPVEVKPGCVRYESPDEEQREKLLLQYDDE